MSLSAETSRSSGSPTRVDRCPECGYSREGLPETGRGPECGVENLGDEIVLYGWGIGEFAELSTAHSRRLPAMIGWSVVCTGIWLLQSGLGVWLRNPMRSLPVLTVLAIIIGCRTIYALIRRRDRGKAGKSRRVRIAKPPRAFHLTVKPKIYIEFDMSEQDAEAVARLARDFRYSQLAA